MKTLLRKSYLITIVILTFLIIGCDDDDFYYDNTPPNSPQNLAVFVGDNKVEITWDHNRESDLAGYNIYYSFDYDGRYELIGNTEDNYYLDTDVNNGDTYFYAVTAYDFNGNESELSYDYAYGTPRPEGFNQAVFDYLVFPGTSGYSFSNYLVTPYNDLSTDFFFENFEGTFYINVWEDTDIQDMGSTENIYDITYAPINGWVPLIEGDNVKYVEAEIGHTYVIWTWNNHFAKIRIKHITNQRMVFDWAYQLVEGERQLKTSRLADGTRKVDHETVIKNHK